MNEKFKEDFEYFKELINNKEFDKTLKKYSWLNFTINSMFFLFLLAIYDLYQKNNNDIFIICFFIIISCLALFKFLNKYELVDNKIKLKDSYKIYLRYNYFKNSIYEGSLLELFNKRDEILNYAITKHKEYIILNYKKYAGISGNLVMTLLYFISNEENINILNVNKKVENYINEIENIDYLVK